MNKIKLPLYLQNKEAMYFSLKDSDIKRLNEILELYQILPLYNNKNLYRNNLIKTSVSDIDIEEKNETSCIESLSAICCKKIKNKNQRTAYNLLNLLENGVLEEESKLSIDYIKRIWSLLTEGNRNIQAFYSDFRHSSVRIIKKGKNILKNEVLYVAPNYKEIEPMLNNLVDFVNKYVIYGNALINAIIVSSIFMAYFVYIHPFLDGNGRTGRLLMNKILIDKGFDKFRYISINSEIVKNKSQYSQELQKIEMKNDGDITEYISYMIETFHNLFLRIANPNRKKLDYDSLSVREKIMLKCIRGSSQGIHVKQYKSFWNSIAKEQGYRPIKISEAEKDLSHLFFLDFIVYDERYTLYPGFKYYNK